MEKTKDDLEKEKIDLEIKELKRKWYKKKEYLQILLPTIIAFFSLIYAIVTGFFSTKYEQFELKKEQLKTETLYFEQKKEQLLSNNASLKTSNDSLAEVLQKKNVAINSLKNELTNTQTNIKEKGVELAELKSKKTFYDEEINNLQVEYDRKKKAFEGELEKQYLNESDLTRKIKEKDDIIGVLKWQVDMLNYQVKIVDSNPFIQKSKKFNFSIWNSDQMIKYLQGDQKKTAEEKKRVDEEIRRLEKRGDSLDARYKAQKVGN